MNIQAVKPHAVIVGSGIAGLSAAYRLQQSGFHVEVIEREDHVGGRLKSIRLADCTIDAGATAFLPGYREMFALLRDLGLEDNLEPVNRIIGVPRNGRVYEIDMNNPLSAAFSGLISWKSKFALRKLAAEFRRVRPCLNPLSLGTAAAHDKETLAEFCRRTMPAEVYDYVLNPALKFVYLHSGENGSLLELLWWIYASLGRDKIRSLRGGTGSLADVLATKVRVLTGCEVTSVARDGEKVRVRWQHRNGETETRDADACVVAVPGAIAATICHSGLSEGQRAFLASRSHEPCIAVSFVTRQRPASNVLAYMLPDQTSRALATIIQEQHIGATRVPIERGVVNGYFLPEWSRQHMDASDEAIVAAAREHVQAIVPEVADCVATHVQRWAYPAAVCEVGDCARMAAFEAEVDGASPIQIIGDFQAQASMNVGVANGEQAARRLKARLAA